MSEQSLRYMLTTNALNHLLDIPVYQLATHCRLTTLPVDSTRVSMAELPVVSSSEAPNSSSIFRQNQSVRTAADHLRRNEHVL